MVASRASGLLASLRRLLATLVGIVETRIELLSVEIEEQALLFWQLLLLAAAILVFSGLALLAFSAWLLLLFWDNHPLAALGGLTLVYLAAALAALLGFRARCRTRPRLFATSLAELARDRVHLTPPP
jgi:uncharacterized membrane protein YqjE